MKWERALRRTGTRNGQRKDTGIAYKKTLAAMLFFMGLGTAGNFIYADVTVADKAHAGTVVKPNDHTYNIYNQQVNGSSALNKFNDFDIKQNQIANLHLNKLDGTGLTDRQINIVNNKINVDGVVNALKNGKIGGDVYFFSDKGIAVGASGVFNVGRLTLGTNTAMAKHIYMGTELGRNMTVCSPAQKGRRC